MSGVKERFWALLRSNDTPHGIALGTAIGVFIGITPLYGFHTLLFVLAACCVRRVNKIAILIGTNISIPPTMPLITWFGYTIGCGIFPGRYPALDAAVLRHLTWYDVPRLFVPLFVGSLALGLVLAVVFYGIVFFVIRGYRMRLAEQLLFFGIVLGALAAGGVMAAEQSTEKIVYQLSPVGKSEYNDFGRAKLDGRDVRFATFRTQAMGFDDTEKIYSDPETFLPIRVERNISLWLKKEHIVEEYDQVNFRLTIKKYNGRKVIETRVFQEKGPIQNAILLPFSLRCLPEIDIGWKETARFPKTFEVKLVAIEQVTVPAGTFKTYHFTSFPNKFEIWITCDEARVPVKIKGEGGLGYVMQLQSREVR